MDLDQIGEIADNPEIPERKPVSKSVQQGKTCQVCKKGITKENTPTILYYSKFCSTNCKERYMYSTDL